LRFRACRPIRAISAGQVVGLEEIVDVIATTPATA
jgi:hypothetical protein